MKYLLALGLSICFLGMTAQIVDIPDERFLQNLIIFGVDTNGDGQIQNAEAEVVESLDLFNRSILDLKGIEAFVNLKELDIASNRNIVFDLNSNSQLEILDCSDIEAISFNLEGLENLKILDYANNNLTTIDLSTLVGLEELRLQVNDLNSLDLSNNIRLKDVRCGSSEIRELDIRDLVALERISCQENGMTSLLVGQHNQLYSINAHSNQLEEIDVTGCPMLNVLSLDTNRLTELDVSLCPFLEDLDCSVNQITELDLSQNLYLQEIFCNENRLTFIDLSNNPIFERCHCQDNEFIWMNLKNGSQEEFFGISDNPTLEYVCADPEDFTFFQEEIDEQGYNVNINSYCSFEPGGAFYRVEGQNRYNPAGENCMENDDFVANFMKFDVIGDTTGIAVSDGTGFYSISLQAGDYTIIPNIENPELFTIDPDTINVSFSLESENVMQDFCVTPNNPANDLEIFIVTEGNPRPGFASDFEIIYKNKGNTLLSGTVHFYYPGLVSEISSITPEAEMVSSNELRWNFENLKPFESRSSFVSLLMNRPTDDPGLDAGEILSFAAKVEPIANDVTPIDNEMFMDLVVVNGLDPNDVTCLEGEVLSSDFVGEFVHYRIRFENLGTAEAINIAIVNPIDTENLEIESIEFLESSHAMNAAIFEDRTEMFFENINLPFQDDTNDGYVIYKIKTKETLTVGDVFENQAEIYFDFNFPIITNLEETMIELPSSLQSKDREELSISVFPNPASEYLYFDQKVDNYSISIFNVIGQQMKINEVEENRVGIKELETGVYHVILRSESNTQVISFVKE